LTSSNGLTPVDSNPVAPKQQENKVEVHGSQTRLVPRSRRAVTARPAAMLRAAFTSVLQGPAPQATHWKTAWLLRFSGATCPQ
jgi:hypothetical protein